MFLIQRKLPGVSGNAVSLTAKDGSVEMMDVAEAVAMLQRFVLTESPVILWDSVVPPTVMDRNVETMVAEEAVGIWAADVLMASTVLWLETVKLKEPVVNPG